MILWLHTVDAILCPNSKKSAMPWNPSFSSECVHDWKSSVIQNSYPICWYTISHPFTHKITFWFASSHSLCVLLFLHTVLTQKIYANIWISLPCLCRTWQLYSQSTTSSLFYNVSLVGHHLNIITCSTFYLELNSTY